MKVLIVMHNMKREGAQLVAYALAVGLSKSSVEVSVAAVDSIGPLADELAANGVAVSTFNVAASRAYDVVLVNTIMLHTLVKELLEVGATLVWLIHESNLPVLYDTLPGLKQDLEVGTIHERCAKVVHVCKSSIAEFHTAHPSANQDHVHNGVDIKYIQSFTEERDRVRESLGIKRDEVVVITAGTPKERKGQLGVAEACNALGVRCLVVGASSASPAECTEYEQAIHTAGGTLVERGPAAHVYRHMAASDVYVCNSSIESFPLSILEAMSLSLPVVSTDINGIPEQVSQGTEGLLYSAGDLDALKTSLQQIISAHPTRTSSFGKAACARAEKDFSLEAMVAKWRSILASVANPSVANV